jgi:DNA-binding transcriptional LysR family regulator
MFEVQPVLDDEFVAITSRGAVALPDKVTPADLAKLPVVLYESSAHTRHLIDQWAIRAGIALKPVMELGSVEAIKELVGAGLGCSVVPRMALPNAPARRRLIVRPLHPKLSRKLAIVMRRDKPLQRGLREVAGAIKTFADAFVAPAIKA